MSQTRGMHAAHHRQIIKQYMHVNTCTKSSALFTLVIYWGLVLKSAEAMQLFSNLSDKHIVER